MPPYEAGSLETYTGKLFSVTYSDIVREGVTRIAYGFLHEVTERSIVIFTQQIIAGVDVEDADRLSIERMCIHSMTLLGGTGIYLTPEICGEAQYEVCATCEIVKHFLNPKISVINTGDDNATS